jgi:ubiquinol-cytochrome c reductase iron-sulfur subunit
MRGFLFVDRYIRIGGAGDSVMGGAVLAKNIVTTFVEVMSPASDVIALANIEVDLSTVPEGETVTFKWRGKPLFVRHRTPEEIASVQEVPLSSTTTSQ